MPTGGRLRVAAGTACALLALAAPAAATETGSRSFTAPGEHAFVVPPGVTAVQVTLTGANGGNGFGSHAGLGATVTATLAATPGETLFAEVGGDGEEGEELGTGGYNGGGAGGLRDLDTEGAGGGGGGASDLRTCSTSAANASNPADCSTLGSLESRLLVAAGGAGGGGDGFPDGGLGGEGGGGGERGSIGAKEGFVHAFGGEGGTAGQPGAGGAGGGSGEFTPASGGVLGEGGAGGEGTVTGGGGGGGGGGLYGGGGGGGGRAELTKTANNSGGGGGGGGGSSGVPAGFTRASAVVIGAGGHESQPAVTVTWTLPPPGASTGTASAVTSTTATLNGTVNPDGSTVSDCHFTVSPAPSGGPSIPCAQQVGSGSTPAAVSANVADLSPAILYTVTLVASSAQGTSTGAPVTFTTPAPVSYLTPSIQLTVANLKLSPVRFRRGGHPARISKATTIPTATTISFSSSLAASVTLSFEQVSRGVLVGKKCEKPSKTHRAGKHCTRDTAVPHHLTLTAHAGLDRITFDGVLSGGAHLSPNTYRLTLRVTSGTLTAVAAQHPTFTLLG